jgi:malate synthase
VPAHSSNTYVERAGLQVGVPLAELVESEVAGVTGVGADRIWAGLAGLVADFGGRNAELLATRASLQAAIDHWHRSRRDQPHDHDAYRAMLEEIGYLVPEGPPFEIETSGVDPELASLPGPQLVVPVTNARYALNAANARWGSLYDALYGTDALGDRPPAGPYDPVRGERVIAWARAFLDRAVPLAGGSHADATGYQVLDRELVATLGGGATARLADPSQLAGYAGDPQRPANLLFRNNGLHIELVVDPSHTVGAGDAAGIADVVLEAAVTTIIDCEDSVAAVDAADKALAYRNWLGLMTGALTEQVTKDGETLTRSLAADRT